MHEVIRRIEGGGRMLVSTTWNVAGHQVIETKGEVFGLVVRTRSVAYGTAAVVRLDPSQAHVGAMPG